MTAKEYLSQAYWLDRRINSMIAQVDSLNLLVEKVTSTITGMPKNPSPAQSPMADAICRIIDLEREITDEIDRLVDLKVEISRRIKSITRIEYRLVLELRYLCFKSWEQIAEEMGYTVRNIHILHGEALQEIRVPD